MKPRIEKKLSKKLFNLIGNKLGKVWIDNEVDWGLEYYRAQYRNHNGPLTGHQECYRRNGIVSVNHVPSVGGGFSCGEQNRSETLLSCAKTWLLFELGEQRVFVDEDGDEHLDMPVLKARMTGLWIMKQARNRAHYLKSQ